MAALERGLLNSFGIFDLDSYEERVIDEEKVKLRTELTTYKQLYNSLLERVSK